MGVARQKERAATVKQRKAVFQAEKESETLHTHFMIANHVNETTSSRMVTKVRMTTIELGFDWFSIILAFSID